MTDSIPYEHARSGNRAREQITRILQQFGCSSVGFRDEFEEKALYLNKKPWSRSRHLQRAEYERKALEKGLTAVPARWRRCQQMNNLESLRTRGMKVSGFREGNEARDAILEIARLLREMREAEDLSQAEFAARVGMSQEQISRLETGVSKRGPRIEQLAVLAGACNRKLVVWFEPVEPSET